MAIQSINQQNNSPSFQARIRLSGSNTLGDLAQSSAGAPFVASIAGSGSAAGVASTASHVVGSGSNVLATASSLKSSEVDSFGIVPSAIAYAGAHGATPATVASANAHPSTMSSIMSSIGNFFSGLAKVGSKTKDPS